MPKRFKPWAATTMSRATWRGGRLRDFARRSGKAVRRRESGVVSLGFSCSIGLLGPAFLLGRIALGRIALGRIAHSRFALVLRLAGPLIICLVESGTFEHHTDTTRNDSLARRPALGTFGSSQVTYLLELVIFVPARRATIPVCGHDASNRSAYAVMG